MKEIHTWRSSMIRNLMFLFVVIFSLNSQAVIDPVTPDQGKTPGELCSTHDPDFKEFRYGERIPYCERNVTTQRKKDIYSLYFVPKHLHSNYTIDHYVPLSLGGNNADENLWPEHKKIKELRKTLEWDLYQDLKSGRITQREAIEAIIYAKHNPPLDIQALEGVFY